NAVRGAAGEPPLDRKAFSDQWALDHPKVDAPISDVLDQIDYAVRLLGVDHVGIGSDFDGVDGELPEGLRTVADFPNLVAGLQERGHSDEAIRKILGGNLMRVWAEIEAGAEAR
ncbi:MAG: membrane dipeptidase, partial [Gammaproteobacteria bacterium]|nr:membrane dipeptidase [Gammaproteobacteria bacterium]